MNAYDELTLTGDAELVRMDRQFARWTAPLIPLALARSPFHRHIVADVGTGLGAVAAQQPAELRETTNDVSHRRLSIFGHRTNRK